MKLCPQCDTGYPDTHTTCPTHGGLLSEIRDLKPGMVIRQSYRIVRKLGQGGMGSVYLAQHTLMDEPRALKFLSTELSSDQAFTTRFLREVRTLRQIRHRNVVGCGDLERAEDDAFFFSMEFVDGPDLRDLLRNPSPFPNTDCHPERSAAESKDPRLPLGALPVPLALSIAHQIAEGLGAAHAKGMVHRDIKPENILMAREGENWVPKIADFGIVATKESSTAYTRTGGTLLTMSYAAPEQWRGMRAAQLDGRTDFYALGGVLFEMLTGRTVFDAESYEGWAEQHRNAAPCAPSSLRTDVANWSGLDALVLRMLAKDREQRPADVAELLRLLDAIEYRAPEARRASAREARTPMPRVAVAAGNAESQLDSARHPSTGIAVEAESAIGSNRRNVLLRRAGASLLILAAAGADFWIYRGHQETPAEPTAPAIQQPMQDAKPVSPSAGTREPTAPAIQQPVQPAAQPAGLDVASPAAHPFLSAKVELHSVTQADLERLRIALLSGRMVSNHVNPGSRPEILIGERLANLWWPGMSPIGEVLRTGNRQEWFIVGVVSDPPAQGGKQDSALHLYAASGISLAGK